MSQNITNKMKVFCRIRGFSIIDHFSKAAELYKLNPILNTLEIENKAIYSFTKIFNEDSQSEIFQTVMGSIIKEAFMNQKPGLVFSYGITNSGKTYTIIGNDSNQGILPRLLEKLIEIKQCLIEKKDLSEEFDFNIKDVLEIKNTNEKYVFDDIKYMFEAFEIYNDEIADLSQETVKDKLGQILPRTKLQLKDVNKKYVIRDLKQIELQDSLSIQTYLTKILKNRSFNETLLNRTSSRSHSLFKITILLYYKSDSDLKEISIPILIVDLAGSERAKRIDNFGQSPLMKEACNINKSLFALGQCLKELSNLNTNNNKLAGDQSPMKSQIISYRNSKLTKILFEYFMDHCNISMILNINANPCDFEETVRVLEYAGYAKQIQSIKTVIGSKYGLVSEKKSPFLKTKEETYEKDVIIIEREKKIEKLEEIISNLNDKILLEKIMSKINQITYEFNQENERIFKLEREDNEKFRAENQNIYSMKIFTNQPPLKINPDTNQQRFSLDNEEFQSIFGSNSKQNKEELLVLKETKEMKEFGMNTSPNIFSFENKNYQNKIFEDKACSPFQIFKEYFEKSQKKSRVLEEISDKKPKNMIIMKKNNEETQTDKIVHENSIEKIESFNKNSDFETNSLKFQNNENIRKNENIKENSENIDFNYDNKENMNTLINQISFTNIKTNSIDPFKKNSIEKFSSFEHLSLAVGGANMSDSIIEANKENIKNTINQIGSKNKQGESINKNSSENLEKNQNILCSSKSLKTRNSIKSENYQNLNNENNYNLENPMKEQNSNIIITENDFTDSIIKNDNNNNKRETGEISLEADEKLSKEIDEIMIRCQKNNRKEEKENNAKTINSRKKNRKKARKNRKKSIEKEEVQEENKKDEEKAKDDEYDLEEYKYISIHKELRETPIIKRLRVRPNAKKHQCF